MGFEYRVAQTNKVIQILKDNLWGAPVISERLVHVDYGAEHIVPNEVHRLIRFVRTETIRHIRFAPDFFVVDRKYPERTYLLEYKCTQTPLYSSDRISMICRKSPRKDINARDIGQWEAEAYENYKALSSLGIRVVILNYCAYHDRSLVCDFIEKVTPIHRDRVRSNITAGSRTPFINFDLRSMRSLEEFLVDEHGFSMEQVKPLIEKAKQRLKNELPVRERLRRQGYSR